MKRCFIADFGVVQSKKNSKMPFHAKWVEIVLCSICGCGSGNDAVQSVSVAPAATPQTADMQVSAEQTADTQKADAQADAVQTVSTQADASQAFSQQEVSAQAAEAKPAGQNVSWDMQSGEDLDVVTPDAAGDEWYKKGNIYTDENGRRLEVFFDDEGMLEFALDGLSVYFASADKYQLENNWRIYTCGDGTNIIYYPGTPAHLEISDGEYTGLYEACGDKVK